MKARYRIIAFGFTFLTGVVVGAAAYHLHVVDEAAVGAKVRWLVCGFHQNALYDQADLYRQKFGRWPTNVQELVNARVFPEFSEAHFCPSQLDMFWTNYPSGSLIETNLPGIVASCGYSPYSFRVVTGKFTVICGIDKEHTR